MKIVINQPLSFSRLGQRENQEDARYPDMDVPPIDSRVFVVCDGVGGSKYGEIASHIVATAFGECLNAYDLSDGLTNNQFSEALDYAFNALNQKAQEEEFTDMSTTFTLAVLHGGGATLAHMGDSRVYHYRPSQGIIYKSEDHSLVNLWVRDGIITPEEAAEHPRRNVITRCMSPEQADKQRDKASLLCTDDIEAGDYILLCTDGVLHGLSDDYLCTILADNTQSDDQKLLRIADACKDSDDNNTAMLIPIKNVMGNEKSKEGDEFPATSGTQNMKKQAEVVEVQSIRMEVALPWYKRIFKRFCVFALLACLSMMILPARSIISSMVFNEYWAVNDTSVP